MGYGYFFSSFSSSSFFFFFFFSDIFVVRRASLRRPLPSFCTSKPIPPPRLLWGAVFDTHTASTVWAWAIDRLRLAW